MHRPNRNARAPGFGPFASMQLNQFRTYVDFQAADEPRLQALWTRVEPEVDAICELFYARAMADPVTRGVLQDPSQVQRLMKTLAVWLRELLLGPWDEAYAERRRRIGEVHVHVGVPHEAMFSAICVVRQRLLDLAFQGPDVPATVSAVSKVTMLDLALMTSTYHSLRRQQVMRDVEALLVAHMPAMVLLLDDQGRVLAATPAVAWRFNLDSVVGRHVGQVLPEALEDAMELPARIERALVSGKGVSLPRLDVHLDGQLSHLAVTLVPLRRDQPTLLLHIDDHTMAVRNEALLQRQESLATLGALSATIAHEIRNPLAGISGALQVIAAGMEGESRYAPIIGKVLDQVRSLNHLVNDLLSFARPREAQVTPGCCLRPVAEDVATIVQADSPRHRIEVVGESTVAADPDMVRQILHNLVRNACEAQPGQGAIQIRLQPGAMSVEDDGPGIATEARARLFQPFFTTKLKGTGLGLATCQRMAESMGARMEVSDPVVLQGAHFRVIFP
jgi:signal transduction histidine kinase